MRLVRCLCAAVLALVVTLGNAGLVQQTTSSQDNAAAVGGMSGPMPVAAEEMPDCPACDPGAGNAAAVCAQACAGLAAILPVAVVAPPGLVATDRSGRRRGRLTGTAAGPEPHPPKAFVLT